MFFGDSITKINAVFQSASTWHSYIPSSFQHNVDKENYTILREADCSFAYLVFLCFSLIIFGTKFCGK